MDRVSSLKVVAALFVSALLAACGGGSSRPADGTESPGASAPMTPRVASGVLVAEGSTLRVNGARYETDRSTIVRVDGARSAVGDLRTGMVVTVRGRSNGVTGFADEVDADNEVRGDVTVIDAAANPRNFSIGMLTVIVNADTRYDDLPFGFDSLRVGMPVEVYGMRDAAGALVATLVESKAGEPDLPDEIKGVVAGLDAAASTFRIGDVSVRFGDATFLPAGATAASLANGLRVEVEGGFNADASAFIAARVEIDDRTDGGEREIEGFVAQLAVAPGGASGSFAIDGRSVTFDGTTRFRDGTVATLANNVHVEVEGAVLGDTLRASVIRFVPPDDDDEDDDESQ
jgi:hypothetical protein